MVTIAHIVKKMVEEKPFLEEALIRGVINYAALAEDLKDEVRAELKTKVETAAIMMALRRIAESKELRKTQTAIGFEGSDITLRSDLVEITIAKSVTVLKKIQRVYDTIDFAQGDVLTVTQGLYEITIIASRKHKKKLLSIFETEHLTKVIDSLASVTVRVPVQLVNTPGFFYVITKALNWENINIVEIVSTLTELTFILREDDVAKGFDVVKKVISK